MSLQFLWPEEFEQNVTEFSTYPIARVLAMQLCAWGNVFMQQPRPDNFFEVMDAASKVTGAFTPDQCKERCDVIIREKGKDED